MNDGGLGPSPTDEHPGVLTKLELQRHRRASETVPGCVSSANQGVDLTSNDLQHGSAFANLPMEGIFLESIVYDNENQRKWRWQ